MNYGAIIYYGNIIKKLHCLGHYPYSFLFNTNHYVYYLSSSIEGTEKANQKQKKPAFQKEIGPISNSSSLSNMRSADFFVKDCFM